MSLQSIEVLTIGLIPISLFLTAITNERNPKWQLARLVTFLGLILTLVVGLLLATGSLSFSDNQRWMLTSSASVLILGLVTFIGFVNLSYSRVYMSGNAEEEMRYLRWLLVTLGCVVTVVITNHMLVLIAAWISISLSLEKLLIFFPNRPRAVLAAHKKFIFARLAESLLLCAILILHDQHGTWFISELREDWLHGDGVTAWDRLAAVCLVLAASVKCAQLPLHGWLIQVVEAPTPVSALLHAGIINLGGYLLIIFAPLISASQIAQALLLFIGGITTVLAALIMMTRASVKVRLAWSTMSQMGLMLVECGLGLYELALLHLLAHSCYKAYSFLNAGSEVDASVHRRLAASLAPSKLDWVVAAVLSFGIVFGWVWLEGGAGPYSPWLLLAVALTLLIAERRGVAYGTSLTEVLFMVVFLLFIYSAQKLGLGLVVPPLQPSLHWAGDLWISLLIVFFVVGYILVRYQPNKPFVNRFRRALYAGFYLDEWVTRMSLRLYPTRLPERMSPKKLNIPKEELYQ